MKLFKEYLPDTESMNEAKTKICLFMRAASSNVFEVTKIQNRQAIIMEYVKGEHW